MTIELTPKRVLLSKYVALQCLLSEAQLAGHRFSGRVWFPKRSHRSVPNGSTGGYQALWVCVALAATEKKRERSPNRYCLSLGFYGRSLSWKWASLLPPQSRTFPRQLNDLPVELIILPFHLSAVPPARVASRGGAGRTIFVVSLGFW